MNIPSAVSVLNEATLPKVRFIKPALGSEIINYHQTDDKDSLATRVMAVRGLKLREGDFIPCHVHRNKEKIYIFGSESDVIVYVWNGAVPEEFTMSHVGDTVVVPAGKPHALYSVANDNHTLTKYILVVTSSQDGSDIEWEPDTDTLIKNEHLNK